MTRKDLTAPDMEKALIGAALIHPEHFALEVTPADFHGAELGRIWEAGRALVDAGGYVDVQLIGHELERRGMENAFGKLAQLTSSEGVNAYAAPDYAQRVRDMARRRAAAGKLQQAVNVLHSSNGTWPQEITALAEQLATVAQPPATRPDRQTRWTGAELMAATFPDPQWAVPDLIPVGLTYLAGRPKVGKSWLALQIAIAVDAGGMVLDRRVDRGRVLYIALEDAPRRLAGRLDRQHAAADAGIDFCFEWRRFTEGGLQDLTGAMEREGYTLAVVDTFGRVLGNADQDDNAVMTELVGELQNFAGAHDVSIMLLDHHRKPSGFEGNPIDDILGSTAKAAVADAALGLFKQNGKREVMLKVTGRDVEEQELVLSFDPVTCCWQLEGTAQEVAMSGKRGEVLEALRDLAPETATGAELAQLTGIDRGNLTRILNDLAREGMIDRLKKDGRNVPYRLRAVDVEEAAEDCEGTTIEGSKP